MEEEEEEEDKEVEEEEVEEKEAEDEKDLSSHRSAHARFSRQVRIVVQHVVEHLRLVLLAPVKKTKWLGQSYGRRKRR